MAKKYQDSTTKNKPKLTDAQKEKLKQIHERSQQINKDRLYKQTKYFDKKRTKKQLKAVKAISELSNPNLVYILGGQQNEYAYIHSHTETWNRGLRTSINIMTKFLKELVDEQKKLMKSKILQINATWSRIFSAINEEEKRLGNNVNIKDWLSFVEYYNDFGKGALSSPTLQNIIDYKMSQSALNFLKINDKDRETVENYIGRLLKAGLLSEDEAKKISSGELIIDSKVEGLNKSLKKISKNALKGFIGSQAVTDWIYSLDKNSKTFENYETIKQQLKLKPNAKQLGYITEHALKTSIPEEIKKQIDNTFEKGIFDVVVNTSSDKGKDFYSYQIAGETKGNEGNFSNDIQKGDLMRIMDLGQIRIQFPSSVKLSMRVKEIKELNGNTSIQLQDLFTAGAKASSLDFEKINQNVGSQSYAKNRAKMLNVFNYVYSNASAIPSDKMQNFKTFNNKVVYYLAWLKLLSELIGNQDNSNQQVIALESIDSIHNIADVIKKLIEIDPVTIKNYIKYVKSPGSDIQYANSIAVLSIQREIDSIIAKLWDAYLNKDGAKVNYEMIYQNVVNEVLNRFPLITKRTLPSISLSYVIPLNNIRALSI